MYSKLNSNMDFCYFIGIDIAKETLDWAVYTQQGVQLSIHTPNTLVGIKTALAEFKALPGWNPKLAVFCMEYTGIYNAHLLELLHQQKLAIWLESSLQIKQAGGMQPHRFLWIKQGLAHNFCHIFHLDEPPRKPGESVCCEPHSKPASCACPRRVFAGSNPEGHP